MLQTRQKFKTAPGAKRMRKKRGRATKKWRRMGGNMLKKHNQKTREKTSRQEYLDTLMEKEKEEK